MTLFNEMLAGLRDARKLASPYTRAADDPSVARRKLAAHFDELIRKAEQEAEMPLRGTLS